MRPSSCRPLSLGTINKRMPIVSKRQKFGRPLTLLICLLLLAVFVVLPRETSAETRAERKPASARISFTGKALYDFNCASCHGQNLKGDGSVAQALKTPPTDLTTLARNHGGKFPREKVFGYIVGTIKLAAHGTREMPVWGPALGWYYPPYGLYVAQLSDAERNRRVHAIVSYVASKQVK